MSGPSTSDLGIPAAPEIPGATHNWYNYTLRFDMERLAETPALPNLEKLFGKDKAEPADPATTGEGSSGAAGGSRSSTCSGDGASGRSTCSSPSWR